MTRSTRFSSVLLLSLGVLSLAGAQAHRSYAKTNLPKSETFSADIKGVVPGAVVQTDSLGRVRRVRGSVRAQKGAISSVDAATAFLVGYHNELGLSADLSDLKGDRAFDSLGGNHVTFKQVYHGLEVFGGSIGVHFDPQGNLVQANNDLKAVAEIGALAFNLSSRAAVVHAEGWTGQAIDPRYPSKVAKGVFVVSGVPKAAYKVNVRTVAPSHSYETMVDAVTGEVLQQRDLLQHVTALVFDPNPVATSGTANLIYDNTAAPVTAIQNQRLTKTLLGLDASGHLTGTFADTSPSTGITRATVSGGTFNFSYLSPNFDEVMAYYHVDTIERFIQSLGFNNINNRQIGIDVDGIPDDNSFYDPSTTQITFGSGGVPDAQDADVVWHENGHSIQDNQVPGWGATEEGGAMGEGFGDYWAGQHGAGVGPQSPAWDVFTFKWDATAYNPGTPAFLRRLDSTKHYPEDIVHEVHDDGELWSACLWQVRTLLGSTNANKVILQAHFLLSTTANFADGSNAIVSANQTLFAGANGTALRNIFVARGFLAPAAGSIPTNLTTNLATAVGGNQLTGTVTISPAAPAGGQVVDLTSDQPIPDLPANVTVASGATTATFTFTPNGVDSTSNYSIHASAGGTTVDKALTINPATLTSLAFSPTSVVGGNSSTGTVTLNGKAGPSGRAIGLSSPSVNVVVPGTVSVLAQAKTVTFTATTKVVPAATTVTCTATQAGQPSKTANLTLNPLLLTSFTTNVTSLVGGNTLTITPRVNGAAPTGGVVVTIAATLDPSGAVTGVNQPSTITIPAGQVAQSVSFVPNGRDTDTAILLKATFNGVTLTKQVTIKAATVASLTFSPTSVVGGNGASGVVKLTGFAGPSGKVVTLTPNSSLITIPASVNVASQKNTVSFSTTTQGVAANTTVSPTANTVGQVPVAGSLTLTPGLLSVVYTNMSSVVGGNSLQVAARITGKAPAGGTVVNLSCPLLTVNVPASLTIPAGASTAGVSFTLGGVDADTATTISGKIGAGAAKTANVTIKKATFLSFSFSPGTVVGGNNVTAVLKLNGKTGPSGASATLTTSDPAVPLPASLAVAAQSSVASVIVTTTAVSATKTVTGHAIAPSQNVAGTVTVNPATFLSITAAPSTLTGGANTIITVKLNGKAPAGGLVFNLSSSDSHLTLPATVTIPAGATQAGVTAHTTAVGSQTVVSVSASSASSGGGSVNVTIN